MNPIPPSTWTPETIAAHQASVEHWERLASGERKLWEHCTCDDCALCGRFLKRRTFLYDKCYGCPVFMATGETLCRGTPYQDAYDAMDDFGLDSPEFKAAAKLELEFLKSLRPTEGKP